MKIGGIDVSTLIGGALYWVGGLAIDCDGSPFAYGDDQAARPGLDYLANAGKPANWWALATDNGRSSGTPVRQLLGDPNPGGFISTTALCDGRYPKTDWRRYVNASEVPYISVPPELIDAGARVGDLAAVLGPGGHSAAIVADVGPKGHLGEGSPALARAIGVPDDPRRGGCSSGVAVVLFCGSRVVPAWPRADVAERVEELIAVCGGWDALAQAAGG